MRLILQLLAVLLWLATSCSYQVETGLARPPQKARRSGDIAAEDEQQKQLTLNKNVLAQSLVSNLLNQLVQFNHLNHLNQMNQLNQLSQILAITQPFHPSQSAFQPPATLRQPPSFDHPSTFGSPHSPHSPYGQSHGFLFTCDGLQAGFYSDVYNECRYFHLCHQPDFKFANHQPNQLAITTYACPESTYFNQRRLACTRLEEFEMACADQIQLFKSNGGTKTAKPSSKPDAHTEKTGDLGDNLIPNESAYKKLLENRNENERLLDEYASNKLANDSQETKREAANSQTSTVGSAVVPNLESVESSENVTESPTVDSMLEKERAGADKKDEKVESGELIEITFNCEGRPHGYYVDVTHFCRVFHVCQPVEDQANGRTTAFMNSFRCPDDLVFNQATLTCTTTKDLIVPCYAQEMFFASQANNQLLPEPLPESTEKDEIATSAPLDFQQ